MGLQLYNTLTRRIEPLETREPGTVRMYVCGPTVYDHAHIGHALSAIVFDVIRRYLEHRGHRVLFIQNFTDIDDKIINRANELGVDWRTLAERYIREFLEETAALNIKPATHYPRATQELDAMFKLIQGLIDRGYAYAAGGDVYYRVARKDDYGKLSNRNIEELLAGVRVEVGEHKENPLDFALWKSAKPGEPSWESPWGPGRPGWHIECSAMSWRHLGEQIDIHGGGRDLIFPHHENEIAQSEAFHGREPFARYWMHNGLLLVDDEKMSKSLGNFITTGDLLERGEGEQFRYFVITSHYRKPLNFTRADFEAASRGLERLRAAAHAPALRPNEPNEAAGTELATETDVCANRFVEAMDNDFNTPDALAALHDLVRAINRARDAAAPVAAIEASQARLRELAGVLGLTLAEPVAAVADSLVDPLVGLLIDIRADLRAAKQWALADTIRDRLSELGVALEDGPTGTTYRLKERE